MAWLILFGLLHGQLLWYGDILYWYGMCGLVVFFFRKLSPQWLILCGLLSIGIPSVLMLAGGLSTEHWPPGALESAREEMNPPPDAIADEVAAYQGSWLEQMDKRVPKALDMETGAFLAWGAWRVSGLMLLGMALFKLGVFSATRSRSFYVALIAFAVVVGIPLASYGVHRNFAAGWEAPSFFFLGSQFNYWASIPVSLGWVGFVMLTCQSDRLALLKRPFAAVGQTAFSNYILQTVVCTTIFYGHGFGLFGQIERVGQAAVVVAVWAFQLIVSSIWLRYFLYGPLEWLWRSLVYLNRQEIRRQSVCEGSA